MEACEDLEVVVFVEVFLESAPQLYLQSFVAATKFFLHGEWPAPEDLISLNLSWLSLGHGLSSFFLLHSKECFATRLLFELYCINIVLTRMMVHVLLCIHFGLPSIVPVCTMAIGIYGYIMVAPKEAREWQQKVPERLLAIFIVGTIAYIMPLAVFAGPTEARPITTKVLFEKRNLVVLALHVIQAALAWACVLLMLPPAGRAGVDPSLAMWFGAPPWIASLLLFVAIFHNNDKGSATAGDDTDMMNDVQITQPNLCSVSTSADDADAAIKTTTIGMPIELQHSSDLCFDATAADDTASMAPAIDERSISLKCSVHRYDRCRVFSQSIQAWLNATITDEPEHDMVHVEYEYGAHLYSKTLPKDSEDLELILSVV